MKLTRLTFPTSHNECEFFCNEEQTLFYKSCQRKDLYSTYRDAFELEYSCMHELEKDMGTEAYRKFFPVYKKCYVRKKDGKPYISMEYLQGESLESVLDHMKDSRYPEPRDFFLLNSFSTSASRFTICCAVSINTALFILICLWVIFW